MIGIDSYPNSVEAAAEQLRNGELTCELLTRSCITCIECLNPRLNALVTTIFDRALDTARNLDGEFRGGKDRGPLHGIPIVHKDLFDTAGVRTTMGSVLYRDHVPDVDSKVVANLAAAGTVLLGKANMTEFASSGSGANKFFGNVANPWDTRRSPGGSSSGTAAAVAAGMCLGGTGSDTGGSIRIPAGWCGIVGVRPTYGLVPMSGAFPRAQSLDCVGPLARTVGDAAILLNAMVGSSPSASPKPERNVIQHGLRGVRLGLVDGFVDTDVDPEVGAAFHRSIQQFADLGAEIERIRVPLLVGALDYTFLFGILLYEFYQVLGARYRSLSRPDGYYGEVVRANLEKGEQISRKTYEDALAARPRHIAEVRAVFESVDALLSPTTPMVAPLSSSPADVFDRARRFNLPISYLGLPSLSLPCGFSTDGLPIGLQVIADKLKEHVVLRIAGTYEDATRYYENRPPVRCDS